MYVYPNDLKERWILKSRKGRELSNKNFEKFNDRLNRYAKFEGLESRLVNIPSIVTGINVDGTIKEEEIEPYAYEIVSEIKDL